MVYIKAHKGSGIDNTLTGQLQVSSIFKLSFKCRGPVLWNQLPTNIKLEQSYNKFKYLLKEFLHET